MLTLLIVIGLGTGFYAGYRRGFLLQLIYTFGYTVSFFLAQNYYKRLGKSIELLIPYPAPHASTELVLYDKSLLFDLDKSFYAVLAFMMILFIGWLVTRFIGMLSYAVTFIPLIKQGNELAGGLLNVAITYIGLVIFLTMFAMIPLDIVQNMFKKSYLARTLVESTPMLSSLLKNWWITRIIL